MSDESSAPYGVTFKGQGQNDPWVTVRAENVGDLIYRVGELVDPDLQLDEDGVPLPVLGLVARAAAGLVKALNAQEGISLQRDKAASQPAAETPAASSTSPAAGKPRPQLSTSLSAEDDGNYWINIPYTKDSARAARWRDAAKALNARYKADEAPESVPRKKNGQPERPWCVHLKYVSEEDVAELLHLHETQFASVV